MNNDIWPDSGWYASTILDKRDSIEIFEILLGTNLGNTGGQTFI